MVCYFTHKVRTGPAHQCLCTDTGVFIGSEHHTDETLKCLFIFSNKTQGLQKCEFLSFLFL
jgi:hypothetical protein